MSHRPPSRLLLALGALILTGTLAACGSGTSASSRLGAGEGSTTTAAPTTTMPPTTTTTVDPGTLPQTEDRPAASGAGFDARMQALAKAIIDDDPAAGLSSFFPVSAYKQVKKNTDPAGDWNNRLIAEFKVDVHDMHARLGTNASSARFLGVDVPNTATWVKPGEEYNLLPYWRVYNTSLRFDVNGTTKTIPVASMISWRGQWYVVHLGPIR